MSRPFGVPMGKSYQVPQLDDNLDQPDPPYQPPEATMAALEEVSLNIITPSKIAAAQVDCPEVASHKDGKCPRGAVMKEVEMSGTKIYCEISDPANPRPLLSLIHI